MESSGNGALVGRELPPAAVLTADRHISAIARTLKAAGLAGTITELRVHAYLALLSGKSPYDLLPPHGLAGPDGPGTGPDGPGRPGGMGPTHALGPLLAQIRDGYRGMRAIRASLRASKREARRAARAARRSLERELASYTSPGDLNDLDAILERHSEEETADIRLILAARRAA